MSYGEYRQYKDRYGLCIDWETSGNDYHAKDVWELAQRYQGVSMGAVVFDLQTYDIVDSMYVEIQFDPTRYQWTPEVEKIHGLTRDYLAANGVSQEEATKQFFEMYLKYFSPDSTVILLGHNTNYDIAFTDQLLAQFGVMFKLKKTVLDTSVACQIGLDLYRSDDIFHFLGLPERQAHNALEDCVYTVEAARRFRDIVRRGLEGYSIPA